MLNLLMKQVNSFTAATQPPVDQPASYNHSVRFFPGRETWILINTEWKQFLYMQAKRFRWARSFAGKTWNFKELVLLCFMLFNSLGVSYNVQGQENLKNLQLL